LRLAVLRHVPEDPELRDQWNALVLRAQSPQVFYTYEWALAVSRAYGNVLRPLVFLGYDSSDVLSGIAALATDSDGRHVSFLCSTTGDYCDFVSEPGNRESFVDAVLAELFRTEISEITLANLPADSATVIALERSALSRRYRRFARTAYVCTQVDLASLEKRGDGSPVLPRKKMLRHSLNAMGRDNPIRLDHASALEDIDRILPEFMKAHVVRFLYTGRVSNIARQPRRAFLAELARLLSGSGWIVISRMVSGDRTLAWNYGFRFHGTLFWYQPTFDSELEKYSPGFCLLAKLIEDAAGDPELHVLDLGLGAEEYKDRIGNQSRETLYVTLKTSAVRHFLEIIRYRTAQLIRRSPRLEAYVRKTLQRLVRLRGRLRAQGIASTIGYMGSRIQNIVWSKREVIFFEWFGAAVSGNDGFEVRSLGWNELGEALMQYAEDPSTLEYLLRAASRLRRGTARAYCMLDEHGKIVHFAWSTAFEDFYVSELGRKVSSSRECAIIFDCWTPSAIRGKGHYGRTIAVVARRLKQEGLRPWIFSASQNRASLRALEGCGFRHVYSIVRKRFLGLDWSSRTTVDAESRGDAQVPLSPEHPAA
jgi:CelD/BcsL family acetyltransferase involved in cellulose biosynthesis